jgi:protein-S-isoprenylcysteine O-methyltransferase Ste14
MLAMNNQNAQISQQVLSVLVSEQAALVCIPRIRLTTSFVLGTINMAFAACLRYSCYKHLGSSFTFELARHKDHKLITSGPYSIVRHPGYMAVVICSGGLIIARLRDGSWAGECLRFGSETPIVSKLWIAAVLVVLFGLVRRTKVEDDLLRKHFGQEWEEYRKRVPWKIMPGVY